MRNSVTLSVLVLVMVLVLGYGREIVNPGPEPNVDLTTGLMGGKQGGKRTLVALDDEWTKYSHSRFFKSLKKRNHDLSFVVVGGGKLHVELLEWNERKFDNLVLFAPKAEVSVRDVSLFIEKGGNVLVATNNELSTSMHKLLAISGLEVEPSKSGVVDSSSKIPDELIPGSISPRNAFYARNIIKNQYLLPNFESDNSPIAYSGIGHTSSPENVLVARVLIGNEGATSGIPGDNPLHFGSTIQLVSAVQARNNARVAFAGSLDMFSDTFFAIKGASNTQFCTGLSRWVFAELGVLRASGVTHTRLDGSKAELLLHQKERKDLPFSLYPEPEMTKNSQVYRIKDDIIYSIKVEEYNEEKGGWIPYATDDMQLEFIMLDPYERNFLKCSNTGRCSTVFTTPDKHGIFKMRVMYRRLGLSTLKISTQVSLRHLKRSEHERFIFGAYPYYVTIFSLMVGFLVFTFLFLHSEGNNDNQKGSRKSKAA